MERSATDSFYFSSDDLACLRPASAAPSSCKIYGGQASLFGVVDFNRSCEDWRAVLFPLSGVRRFGLGISTPI